MTTFASIVAQIVVAFFQAAGLPVQTDSRNFVAPPEREHIRQALLQRQAKVNKPGAIRVGEIKIAGNTQTRDNVILGAVGIYPGQICIKADLQAAENKLIKLGIFEVDPAKSIRPTVQVIDPDGPGEFKDILVNVQEKPTSSLKPMLAIMPGVGPGPALVFEEVNFDISRWPTSLDDLQSGRSFRGANQKFRAGIVIGPTLQPRVLFSLRTLSPAR